tara:strand:+ start:606 stop:803 length:198 start_codon:yes stop_codon:yes gene_type:complete
MAYLVSPCCGQDYSDSIDKEGYEVYTCDNPKCKEEFSEPIEDYEFEDLMREAYEEDRMEERRLDL